MPRVVEATSESEGEPIHAGSTKKTYAGKKRRATSASESEVEVVEKEVVEEPEDTAAEEEEEDEEEEYEIEKILDAKKGQFGGGRMGYFVKWKGYSEEHNSWVDEKDAGNANLLIEQYWAEKKKSKPGPRKSEPLKPKPKVVEKPSRKSLVDVDSSVEPESVAKKRGRPKKDELPSDGTDARDEEDEDEQRAKKKPRKSNGLARKENKPESDATEVIGNMKKHMKVPSWEDLVETVDTVEREGEGDGELYVFFTLKDKKRVRENSRICAEKFPQKLIMFYESNLRWKMEEDPLPADVL